ncbi:translation initiation factor eIF-2B subunit gamma-like [Contarinia nasturtii]|uniref:translation initiation factor eIF-2B subunit gamma-like n=1 Tax=Contarinia nasturtii TaxID=265458 RepID=UPI0012D3D8A6|nr:translation initiation factor eIF-2B subunit gamma-like [Contarinia nasturtii]
MTQMEFQAIVLAGGRGTRFQELTGERLKCLLPIGPYPMIFYPLEMLQRHGFQEIIVIVLESERFDIQQAIERTPIKAKLDFVTLPADSNFGTAEALRHISDRIKCDFVIVSCDTITNIDLFSMLNCFRKTNASIVAQLFKGGLEADTIVPGPKTKHKHDRDLIGIQPGTQRLAFLASTSDYDETLNLPYHLLHRYGHITMHSRLIDSHIYIIKKWVIDYLKTNMQVFSLKGELIPYIVKKQLARVTKHENEKPFSMVNVNTKQGDIIQFIKQNEFDQKITETSSFNDSVNRNPFSDDLIRCYALNPQENCFGIRVNTTLSYCTINQKIFELWEQLFPKQAPALVSPQASIDSTQMTECAVAASTKISEKTSLKKCILGTSSTVNPKTRISNSVLMNDVLIEEGCIIENSVICDKAVIRRGCVLKNCLVGPDHKVAENTNAEKVHLSNSDFQIE